MAKKKVLVDIFYLHVAQTGIKTYIECLCEEIEKNNSDDFEFIVSPSLNEIRNSSFFKGKTALWKNLFYQLLYFFRKLVIIPWLSIKYNTAIVFSPDILSPLWSKGIKISVIHDAFFWENPKHYNPLWLKIYLALLKAGLRKNAQVITISEYSKKQIKKYLKMPSLPVHVVYPSSNIGPKERSQSQISPIPHPYFLHVGVMEKRKNLLTLVIAFSELVKKEDFQSFKLVLAGQRGPRKTLDDFDPILDLIHDLKLEEKVILPGYVSLGELENYYHHAFAYVFPSLNEGFGMPILEAFSYGLPVIIAKQDTLTEVGGEAVITVKENTPLGFEEAMRKIGEDKELRNSMTALGSNRLKKFSSEIFFLSLKDCFRRVLNE
ncbi:MAG: glycosyltransferase family 1 protein [Anditalea sp.]